MSESKRISHTLPKGYQLEDFEIDEVLGIGGFGITYRARDVHLNRTVAIKEYMPSGIAVRDKEHATVFPASEAHKDDFDWGLDRFRMEAETLVSFRHPNIVQVFRFFRANGTAYLVMEYQDGRSLGDILGRDGTLSASEIDEIIFPLLEGLEQVHEAGFMHRDIKPANIFILRDGKPVLIDFGAARQAMGGHSRALTSIVTAGYAPYEQYESESIQGPWTDVYALGATLYRAVTGKRSVEAPKRAGAVMRGEPDPNQPASEVAKGKYPENLLHAIDAALNVLQDKRPQSVAEFRAYLQGEASAEADTEIRGPVAAAPPQEGATLLAGDASLTGAQPTGAPTATQPTAGHPAAGYPTGAAPTGSPPTASPPTAAPPAQGERSSRKAVIWIAAGFGALLLLGGAAIGAVYYAEQQAEDEAKRKAEERRLAALEAKRKAEEDARKRAAEARRKADEQRKAAEARRKAEEERRKAALRDRTDPEGPEGPTTPNDNNNATNNNANTPANVGPLLGRWCNKTIHVTFAASSVSVRNLKNGTNQTYSVSRYQVTPTVVRIYFTSAGNAAIFVFHRTAHSTINMTLKQVFLRQRWRTVNAYFSRNC